MRVLVLFMLVQCTANQLHHYSEEKELQCLTVNVDIKLATLLCICNEARLIFTFNLPSSACLLMHSHTSFSCMHAASKIQWIQKLAYSNALIGSLP